MAWETDKEGNVVIGQITSFHVAPAMETAVAVRIEYQQRSEEGEISSAAVQLAMSPQIALRLSNDLARVGRHILDLPRPDRTN